MVAIKNSLINLLIKNIDHKFIYKIQDAIIRTSKIVFHTYNFLNLYFIYLYENGRHFPTIDKQFILTIMLTFTIRKDNRGAELKPETILLYDKFINFYNEHYRHLLLEDDLIYDDKLKQILYYQATDIVTNINVNISEHYTQHINKFVNISFGVKDLIKNISFDTKLTDEEKKNKIRETWGEFRKVKSDLLNPNDPTIIKFISDPKYHSWILGKKILITPGKESYLEDSIHYDVKANPQDYLRCMFTLNKEINILNLRIKENNYFEHTKIPTHKLFHVLPLRSSIVPKNITIDSTALVNLIIERNKLYYLKNIKAKSYELWSKIFNLKNSIFQKRGYQFNYMIHTDGISCSLLFVKLNKNNKPCRPPTKTALKKLDNDCKYIEDVPITNPIKNKLLVAIDPNHGNLISCLAETNDNNATRTIIAMDRNNKKITYKNRTYITFRYTRSQRNVETKKNKYQNIREDLKKSKIDNKTVIEIETELSEHNSKTCSFDKFNDYLYKKIETNRILYQFYKDPIFRKLNFNTYINTQKSESKMLQKFEKKFGPPKNVLIVFGDYEMINTMKGCEPQISKRLRRLLKIYGYEIYKINEYNTSKLCNKCQHEMERIKVKGKDGKDYLSWALLRCKNVKCKTIYNRDHNSSRNMIKITKNIMLGKGRPVEYQRQHA